MGCFQGLRLDGADVVSGLFGADEVSRAGAQNRPLLIFFLGLII